MNDIPETPPKPHLTIASFNEKVQTILDKDQSKLTEADYIQLRLAAINLAASVMKEADKPQHVVYIAADIYQFLLTGMKPAGPPDKKPRPTPTHGVEY